MAAALPEAQRAAIAQLQFDAQEQAYARAFPGAERGIIRDGQEPIGCLWTHRTDEEIRLIDIRLLPVRQGHGHGTAILRKLLEEAERSRRPVRLQVEYINPALRLYRRLGFRETRCGDVHVEMEWLSESRP